MAEIAVMGHGVVGSGVMEVLISHKDSIAKRAKEEVHVKHILDLREFPGLPYSGIFTKDFNRIVNDPQVKIVVEVMGGLEPAYTYVKVCLEHGKSVVTSNKELVAQKGAELLALAQKNNLNFLFEASVGGGIPIIRPISQCLAANEMTEIAGILNGTTNFILTKMIREGMAFDDALKLAQQLGYAERDPSADVEGIDACRKICSGLCRRLGRRHQAYRRGEEAGERPHPHPGGAHVHLPGEPAGQRGRRVQRHPCPGRRHRRRGVLRQGRGEASHRQRRGGRCHRLRAPLEVR